MNDNLPDIDELNGTGAELPDIDELNAAQGELPDIDELNGNKTELPDIAELNGESATKKETPPAEQGSVFWAGVKGFAEGAVEGAVEATKANLTKAAWALPKVASSVERAVGNVVNLGGNAPNKVGNALIDFADRADADLEKMSSSSVAERLGYEDWGTKTGDFFGGVSEMAVKFAPAMATGGATLMPKVFLESVLASDGINAYANTRKLAEENGAGAVFANFLGGLSGLVNYFGGKAMIASGRVPNNIQNPILRELATAAITGEVTGTQAAVNQAIANVAEGKRASEGVAQAGLEGFAEGAAFHAANLIPRFKKIVKETDDYYNFAKNTILDFAQNHPGELNALMESEATDAALAARRAGGDITKDAAEAMNLPKNMSQKERNAVADALIAYRDSEQAQADAARQAQADAARQQAEERRQRAHDVRGKADAGEQLRDLDKMGVSTWEQAETDGLVTKDAQGRYTGGARQAVNIQVNGTEKLKEAVRAGKISGDDAEAIMTVAECDLGAQPKERRHALADALADAAAGDAALAQGIVEKIRNGETGLGEGDIGEYVARLADEVKAEAIAVRNGIDLETARGAGTEPVETADGTMKTLYDTSTAEYTHWSARKAAFDEAQKYHDQGGIARWELDDVRDAIPAEILKQMSNDPAMVKVAKEVDDAYAKRSRAYSEENQIAYAQACKRAADAMAAFAKERLPDWTPPPEHDYKLVPEPPPAPKPQTALEGFENAERLKGTELKMTQDGTLGCATFPELMVEVSRDGVEVRGMDAVKMAKPENAADLAAVLSRACRLAQRNGVKLVFESEEAARAAQGLLAEVKEQGLARAQQRLDTRAGLLGVLFRNGLGTSVTFDEGSFKAALAKTANGRPFVDRHGDIYGFTDAEGGIHFNPAALRNDIAFHEYGHVARAVVEKANPSLWARGMDLIGETDYYREMAEMAKREGHPYFGLDDAGIREDALCNLLGDRGARLVERRGVGAELKKWLKEFWKAFKGALGLADLTEEQVEKMSVEEIADAINAELLRGSEFGVRRRPTGLTRREAALKRMKREEDAQWEERAAAEEEAQREAFIARGGNAIDYIRSKIAEADEMPFDLDWETMRELARDRAEGKFAIAGSKAIDAATMEKAEQMERDGKTREAIFDETGLWKGKDNNWRTELPDITLKTVDIIRKIASSAKTPKNKEGTKFTTLGTIARNNGTFSELSAILEKYEEAKNVVVFLHEGKKTKSGYSAVTLLNPSDNYRGNGKRKNQAVAISIGLGRSDKDVKRSLVHELQHVIQGEENWENGTTSTHENSKEAYLRNPGEIEAEVAASRSVGNENEYRKEAKHYPWETEREILNRYDEMFSSDRAEGKFAAGMGWKDIDLGSVTWRGPGEMAMGETEQTPAGIAAGIEKREALRPWTKKQSPADLAKPIAFDAADLVMLWRAAGNALENPWVKKGEHIPGHKNWVGMNAGGTHVELASKLFGVIDRSDIKAMKAKCVEDGFFRDENADWRATQSKLSIRQERERSAAELDRRTRELYAARVATGEGGEHYAAEVLGHEIGHTIAKMPLDRNLGAVGNKMKTLFDEMKRQFSKKLDPLSKEADKTVDQETRELIAWWHGQDEMPKYYERPSERFAETFGIFLTQPESVAAAAPKAYDLCTHLIASNDRLASAYRGICELKWNGKSNDAVLKRLNATWTAQAAEQYRKLAAETEKSVSSPYDRFTYALNDRFGPMFNISDRGLKAERKRLKEAVRDGKMSQQEMDDRLADKQREIDALKTSLYDFQRQSGGQTRLMIADFDGVMRQARQDGVDWNDVRNYMHMKRVIEIGGRATAHGVDPARAAATLDEMAAKLGREAFAKVEKTAKAFRAVYERSVLNDPNVRELFDDQTNKMLAANTHYVTMKHRMGVEEAADWQRKIDEYRKGNAAAWDPCLDVQTRLGKTLGGVADGGFVLHRLTGSLEATEDPIAATIRRAIEIKESAARNHLVKQASETLRALGAKGVFDTTDAKNVVNRVYGTLHYMDRGERHALVVPRVVYDSFKANPTSAGGFGNVMRFLRNTMTLWNPAFINRAYLVDKSSLETNIKGLHKPLVDAISESLCFGKVAVPLYLANNYLTRFTPIARTWVGKLLWNENTVNHYAYRAQKIARIAYEGKFDERLETARRLRDAGETGRAAEIEQNVAIAREMMARNVFQSAYEFNRLQKNALSTDEIMRAYGYRLGDENAATRAARAWQKAKAAGRWFNRFEEEQEACTKIIAYLYKMKQDAAAGRTGELDAQKRARDVIEYGGTPNLAARGVWASALENATGFFWNVRKEGTLRTIRAIKDHPTEWVVKNFAQTAMPALLKAMMVTGGLELAIRKLFDDDEEKIRRSWWAAPVVNHARWTREAMKCVPGYYQQNYNVVPLAKFGDEVLSMRVKYSPEEFAIQNAVHTAFQKLGHDPTDPAADWDTLADGMWNEFLPNLFGHNPAIDPIGALVGPLVGINPYDNYRQRNVFDKTTWDARWSEPGNMATEMLRNFWNYSPLGTFTTTFKNGQERKLEDSDVPAWLDAVLKTPVVRMIPASMLTITSNDAYIKGLQELDDRKRAQARVVARGVLAKCIADGKLGDLEDGLKDLEPFQRRIAIRHVVNGWRKANEDPRFKRLKASRNLKDPRLRKLATDAIERATREDD